MCRGSAPQALIVGIGGESFQLGALWSAKTRSVTTRPPSRAYTHDASRRARISSQSDIRVAACVCARCAGPGRKWAQANRGLTTNEASHGYVHGPIPSRHLQIALVEWNQEVE